MSKVLNNPPSDSVTNEKETPTIEQFKAFEGAYQYFNRMLFGKKLPDVILNFSRKQQVAGFVAPFRWRQSTKAKGSNGSVHELSINPEILAMPLEYVYSTLVHEQCHIWQFEHGKPSRFGYHNKEWVRKMEAVGLVPSDTGMVGGNKLGQNMSHYPKKKGNFLKTFKKLPEKFKLPFLSTEGEEWLPELLKPLDLDFVTREESPVTEFDWNFKLPKRPKSNRAKRKYTCPSCRMNLWGKPDLNVVCGDCDKQLLET